jgi:FkbM family methyltransferase
MIIPESSTDPLKSQKGQVRFLLEVVFNYAKFGLKRNGYFVDLGGGHPIDDSNTYFIENCLGWRGLIIEPNKSSFELLDEIRASKVTKRAISSTSGMLKEFRFDNNSLGGFVGEEYDNNLRNRRNELEAAEIETIITFSLNDTLIEFHSPKNMDFLSLDVEGAELEVLIGIDFDRFKWRCMTIERLNLEAALLLDAQGYIQVHHNQFDTMLVHKDYLSDIDKTLISPKFLVSPKKDW